MKLPHERGRLKMTVFQRRLRTAMDNAGMNFADLSRATGINQGTLSAYNHGTYVPKQDRVYELAVALNVSPSWLLGLDNSAPKAEDAVVALYAQLPKNRQKLVMEYIRFLISLESE